MNQQENDHTNREYQDVKPKRLNHCIAVIGHNRTGKTTIAIDIMRKWKASNPNRKIVAFDPQNKLGTYTTDYIFLHDKHWQKKLLTLRNCLLVLDDYRVLHVRAQTDPALLQLLQMRNSWNVDIIYITHSPSLVLNTLAYYTTHYFIFYTMYQKGDFEEKIPCAELCQVASRHINKYVKIYGRGEHPHFPHMIVDTEKEGIKAVNIDMKKFMEMTKSK